jgi:thioester reductase-like protein
VSMEAVFLTGTTGFIGGEVLKRILEREPGRRIYALVRADADEKVERRGREALFKLFQDDREATLDARARVKWLRGDLCAPMLGLSQAQQDEVVSECSELVHAAASTEFTLPLAEAEAVNCAGARSMCALAERAATGAGAGRFKRLVHVSTAYVAGRRAGVIRPEDLPGPEGPFSNTYEETKAAAERHLRSRMGAAPITVVRPSIVVGDSKTGRTYNFNVLYFPIKLIHRGVLRYAPGGARTTLDIVPVDYVCDGLLALGRRPDAAGKTYHLTADDDAMNLRLFVERLVAYYNIQRATDGKPPLEPTELVGPLKWRIMKWWMRRKLEGRAKEQFEAFNVYLPYIVTEKRFDATETRRALAGVVEYPELGSYIERVAEYAVTREWGKRVSWDPAGLQDSQQIEVEAKQ